MNTIKTVAQKVATKPAPQNGSDAKKLTPELLAPSILSEKRPEIKKGVPTLEEKLNVLEELNALAEKRDVVKEAIKNVSDFYISPAGNCNVKMTDSNGKTFSISHPAVIEDVLKQVTFKLEQELSKVESSFEKLY